MRTEFWVDDVALDDPDWSWRLLVDMSLPANAARRSSGLTLFPRSGQVTAHGGWGLGTLTVALLVPDRGVNGAVGAAEARLATLIGVLARAASVSRVAPGMGRQTVDVTEVAVSAPAREGRGWRVEATFTLQPFWVEVTGLVPLAVSVDASGVWVEGVSDVLAVAGGSV